MKKTANKTAKKVTKKTAPAPAPVDIPEDAYCRVNSVIEQLQYALDELQSIGLPQEMFDETENRILDAISEAETLQLDLPF